MKISPLDLYQPEQCSILNTRILSEQQLNRPTSSALKIFWITYWILNKWQCLYEANLLFLELYIGIHSMYFWKRCCFFFLKLSNQPEFTVNYMYNYSTKLLPFSMRSCQMMGTFWNLPCLNQVKNSLQTFIIFSILSIFLNL